MQRLPTNRAEVKAHSSIKKIQTSILYLDKECAFDPERERDTDLDRDLERRDDFPLGDLLQVDLSKKLIPSTDVYKPIRT